MFRSHFSQHIILSRAKKYRIFLIFFFPQLFPSSSCNNNPHITSGGCYILVFSIAAITHLCSVETEIAFLSSFSSAGVLVLSVIIYYIIGYTTFLFAMIKMKLSNNNLLFPEYREHGVIYLCWRLIRYCMYFQILFYSVMGNYFFLGSMDHLLSRPNICAATNKDSIKITRCIAFGDMVRFNCGSWAVSTFLLILAYLTVLKDADWKFNQWPNDLLGTFLFAGPAAFLAISAFYVPIILNPFILGWPFNPPLCGKKSQAKKGSKKGGKQVVDLGTFMAENKLNKEIGRTGNKPDVELGSLATNDFGKSAMTTAGFNQKTSPRKRPDRANQMTHAQIQRSTRETNGNGASQRFTLAMI